MFLERTKYTEYVLTENDKKKIINYGKISFPDSLDLDSAHVFCQDVLFNHTRLILGFGYFRLTRNCSIQENQCFTNIQHKQIIDVDIEIPVTNNEVIVFEKIKNLKNIYDERLQKINFNTVYTAGIVDINNELELLDNYLRMVGLYLNGTCNYIHPIIKYKGSIL
jgi:hypothetical protein